MPPVSVVIPVFNGDGSWPRRSGASRPDLPPARADRRRRRLDRRSAAVARSFADVAVIEQENAGPGAARNRGVVAARRAARLSGCGRPHAHRQARAPGRPLAREPRGRLRAGPPGDIRSSGEAPAAVGTAAPEVGRNGIPGSWSAGLQPLSLVVRRTAFDAVGSFSSHSARTSTGCAGPGAPAYGSTRSKRWSCIAACTTPTSPTTSALAPGDVQGAEGPRARLLASGSQPRRSRK